jgi:tetratricopeptide (TPR) repeat protein
VPAGKALKVALAVSRVAAKPALNLPRANLPPPVLLNAEMPAGTKPEEWAKAKKETFDAVAHKTLGWIAWQRKNFDGAEQAFKKSIECNPNQGETAYWLGSALLQSRKADKTASGLFMIARALAVDPARGGIQGAGRQQIDAYLTKTYTAVHGSTEGLDEVKALAKTNPLPPGGFSIKTADEIAAAKEEEFRKANPALALWLGLKKELQSDNGAQFFENTMKNANVPGGAQGINTLRGTLIAAKPAANAKELVLGIEKADIPEVTLRLETPVKGKPVIGSPVDFEGVPMEFTKSPFMVTFDSAKVSNLQTEAPAAPVRRPGGKKGTAKK